ncbi:glucose-1-phosphate cytidylyltransferase [Lachnospiraceae bacterium]|nr:glucose-1-phosphate cytidylyltransferase [Lachnospiraceae bacterium]
MKVVILAGGLGTRISEESHLKPKPMIEIGDKPILWHIMKEYSHYGFNEFVICLGYKQHMVKEFFADYYLYSSDVTFDLAENSMEVHNHYAEPWKVTLVDTGLHTMTGGRVRRIRDYIGDETFMLTYGDGVSDVNIAELLKFHKQHGRVGTITAISVDQRFGVLDLGHSGQVHEFAEKEEKDAGVVNGGYMVFEPAVFDLIEGDDTVFEKGPLPKLAEEGQLMAYRHDGFWKCMDTQREKEQLEKLWASGHAPWKTWD